MVTIHPVNSGFNSLKSVGPFFIAGLLQGIAGAPPEAVDAAIEGLQSLKGELSTIGGLAKRIGNAVADESEKPVIGINGVVKRTRTTTEETEIVNGQVVTERTVNTKTVTDPKAQAAKIRADASQVSDFITGLGNGEIKIGSLVITADEVKILLGLFQEIVGKGRTVDMDELFGGKNSTANSSSGAANPPSPEPPSA